MSVFKCSRFLANSYSHINTNKLSFRFKHISDICTQLSCNKIRQYVNSSFRETATTYDTVKSHGLMSAWYIYKYGNNDELLLSNTCYTPVINDPNGILIEIHAASINPIDVRMRDGYGHIIINGVRKITSCQLSTSEFPLTLGRDFSGIVVDTGKAVTKYKPGDEVWGALGIHRQGSHAQYTVANECEISHKPSTLTHAEAASVPYAALTAWAALVTFGQQRQCVRKRYLVTGGSGGIGTFVIQLLKTWGGHITATCSADAVNLCGELGADHVVDYTCAEALPELRQSDKFDFILDLVGSIPPHIATQLLRPNNQSKYVTLESPLLTNTDGLGLAVGLAKSSLQFGADFVQTLSGGSLYGWAYFMPNSKALATISGLYTNNQIRPVIDKVVPFEELPTAYSKVEQGHIRGKVVVDMFEGT